LETYLTKKDAIVWDLETKLSKKDALLQDKDDEIIKLRTEVAHKDQLLLVKEKKKICWFLCSSDFFCDLYCDWCWCYNPGGEN